MDESEFLIDQVRLLISRLERISADSSWARRSSGQRGVLLRWLDLYAQRRQHSPQIPPFTAAETEQLRRALQAGFDLLERAAREFPARE